MDKGQGARIRLFSPSWEAATLLLGVLPVLFIFWNPQWITERWKMQLVSELLLLNAIHNGFSIYLIWRSKEIRLAVREANPDGPWRLHFRAAAVFSASCALIFAYQSRVIQNSQALLALVSLINFLPFQHGMSQQLGLSLLYDRTSRSIRDLSEFELRRLNLAAKGERLFHRIALAGIAFRSAAEASFSLMQQASWSKFLWWGHGVFALGTAGVIAMQFVRPYWSKSNQWIFNLRRAWDIFPMANFQYIILQRFNHAFEYLAVTRSIEANSKWTAPKGRDWRLPVFLSLSAVVGLLYLQRIIDRWGPTPFDGSANPLTPLFSAASLALTLTHYYYDSQIYRFSKAPFRKHVLPLMTDSGLVGASVGASVAASTQKR